MRQKSAGLTALFLIIAFIAAISGSGGIIAGTTDIAIIVILDISGLVCYAWCTAS